MENMGMSFKYISLLIGIRKQERDCVERAVGRKDFAEV